tara:strand:- start:801 stop:2171 length:1371 start_codon:yes stop_codon:yes gene_type:complete
MGGSIDREIELSQQRGFEVEWTDGKGIQQLVDVPRTVYPPREDSTLLHRALLKLQDAPGRLLEIGCGSGVISHSMAMIGWSVVAIDPNPFAVACARSLNNTDMIVLEGELEEGPHLSHGPFDVIAWNPPYLEPIENKLGPMEEAALTRPEIHPILHAIDHLENTDCLTKDGCIVIIASDDDATRQALSQADRRGWCSRRIDGHSKGGERLAAVCIWRPWRFKPKRIKETESTMDELPDDSEVGDVVITDRQTAGRGRRGNDWIGIEGDLFGTWCIAGPETTKITTLDLHIMSATAVLEALQAFTGHGIDRIGWRPKSDLGVRWPNDLIRGETAEKCGGLLLHARTRGNEVRIHLGIGINGSSRTIDDYQYPPIVKGNLDGLEERIHHALAGWFMIHPRVPAPDLEAMRRTWWAASRTTRVISEKRRGEMQVNAFHLDEEGLHGWNGKSAIDLSDVI